MVGFRVAVRLGGAVVAWWAQGACEARWPGLNWRQPWRVWARRSRKPSVGEVSASRRAAPCRLRYRWSAVVRRSGQRVGRPGVLGLS